MDQGEFKLPSGASLVINVAPFVDAKRLHNEIIRALRGGGIGDLDMFKLKDAFAAGKLKESSVGSVLVDRIMSLAASDELEAAIFKCAECSVYRTEDGDVRVTRKLFDDGKLGTQARGDYYAICIKIVEVNFGPFLKAIFSAFEARAREKVAAQA